MSDIKNKSDNELVKLSLNNPDYFAELVDRYEKKLFRYIRRLSGLEHESIEDILQEVFLKIYTHLNDFDPDLSFSTWAYRISHNETINHLKRTKKTIVLPLETDDPDSQKLIDCLASEINLEGEISRKNQIEKIRECIQLLPHKYREILLLRYVEDLDYREISNILKMPMGTVATTINRAKKKFKALAQKKQILPNA